jgi:zinc transporter ZupT
MYVVLKIQFVYPQLKAVVATTINQSLNIQSRNVKAGTLTIFHFRGSRPAYPADGWTVALVPQSRIRQSSMEWPTGLTVVLLSLVMFIASFFSGTLPLLFPWNAERMRIIGFLGIGLLVGTSLGVVLPEGLEMLLLSLPSMHSISHIQAGKHISSVIEPSEMAEHVEGFPRTAIATTLVLGYLVMYLLTFFPPLLFSLLRGRSQSDIALSPLPSSPRSTRVQSPHTDYAPSPRLDRVPSGTVLETARGVSKTTIGLCFHALADGIALGSSAVSNSIALKGIVFLAIMLHKVLHFVRQRVLIIGASIFLLNDNSPTRILSTSFSKSSTYVICNVLSDLNSRYLLWTIRYFDRRHERLFLEWPISAIFRRDFDIRQHECSPTFARAGSR